MSALLLESLNSSMRMPSLHDPWKRIVSACSQQTLQDAQAVNHTLIETILDTTEVRLVGSRTMKQMFSHVLLASVICHHIIHCTTLPRESAIGHQHLLACEGFVAAVLPARHASRKLCQLKPRLKQTMDHALHLFHAKHGPSVTQQISF